VTVAGAARVTYLDGTLVDPFKSILVDIDATAPAHPALARAIRLARASGATLTIVDVVTVPPYARRYLPVGVEEEMLDARRQQLMGIARGVTDVATDAKLLTGRPGTALIQEVLRSRHDLLMRSHARDTAEAGPKPFGAVDMELLRKCPCPVLLVRHGALDQHPRIAGAVNASTEEPTERVLNIKIAELTLLMARLEEGVPLLLQAWAPFAARKVQSHSSEEAFTAFVEDVRSRTANDLRQLAESVGERMAGVQTVHRQGEPEDVITEYSVAAGIDLVVMGTVARSGIAGLLIGNTAERVLRKLPCSVLAVKPEGD
jgi:nucleotide-binding universal stress UspA family protein